MNKSLSKIGIVLCLFSWVVFALPACNKEKPKSNNQVRLVFKHGKIAGGPALFRQIITQYEKENPHIYIKDETLPASTDEQHQFYVINLEGKSCDFDILSMDVIWIPEFARAGWLKDLTHLIPADTRNEFFKGPMDAVTYRGRVFAIPWYIDAGVLYYRKDLLKKYGFSPPKTWFELVHIAAAITNAEPELYGFIWQGKQYEGLVCNVLEYMWSNGGNIICDGQVVIDSPHNRNALAFMRDLIYKYAITPDFITTCIEESTRHIFGNGKAVFMRNWPYAWNIFERENSPIKGKVGMCTLPSFPGKQPASTLGGWQLGVNRYSRHSKQAEHFIQFLTSYQAQKALALQVGYKPTRKKLYQDGDLTKVQPFMTQLYEVFEHAKPRPVTPYYIMISQVVQPEFSAVLSRIKTPQEALKCAQGQIEFILKAERE